MRNSMILMGMVAVGLACGDDGSSDDGIPERPELGQQIDRHGRAGVTTALISVLAADDDKGDARDDYNAAEPATWSAFTSDIRANLAVYDALDAVCGNQFIADAGSTRYEALAGALADDRLYVNADGASCGQYLAVELDATQVAANSDCGGRTLSYDVIDVTYSALAVGGVGGVTDGVPADDMSPSSTFPFLP